MRNLDKVSGKVVVITGASAGVGRAAAREFGKHKAKVALLARGLEGLKAAAGEIEAMGGEAFPIQVDLADAAQIENAAQQIEGKWGIIDIWINNAMNSVFCKVRDIKPEEFKRVTEVTYLGTVYGTMAALKRMISKNHGSIVLVGSALAYRGIPLQSAYCGAKHGIQGFFDSLRTELMNEDSQIKLSMVQLPALNTTQFGWVKSCLPNKPRPMGKIYQPEVAARAIVYAATHSRREIFVGFSTFQAIIGNKIFPEYVDRVLAKGGIKGQQTDTPTEDDRKNNLWNPVPGDHGAHGSFSNQAVGKSFVLWLTMNTGINAFGWLIIAILVLIIILLIIF